MVAARFGANGRDGNSHKIGLKPEYGWRLTSASVAVRHDLPLHSIICTPSGG